MELYVYIIITFLILSVFINISLIVVCYQYRDLIDTLEKDSASEYRLILEYQRTIQKLNNKIEKKKKNVKPNSVSRKTSKRTRN